MTQINDFSLRLRFFQVISYCSRERSLMWMAALSFAAGVLLRLTVDAGEPLWRDELWTGAAVISDSLSEVFDFWSSEIAAPAHYFLLYFWCDIFGFSNYSIRFPSIITSAAAAPVAWWFLRRRVPDDVLATYVVMLALWLPGMEYASEARYHALWYLGSTVQVVFLFRTLDAFTRGNLIGWTAISNLVALVQYMSLLLSMLQGLLLLATFGRRRFFAVMAAGASFVPVLALVSWHHLYIDHGYQTQAWWWPATDPGALLETFTFILGSRYMLPGIGLIAVGLAVAAVLQQRFSLSPNHDIPSSVDASWRRNALLVGAVSLLGLITFLLLARVMPLFNTRYLFGYVPGLLLGTLAALSVLRANRRLALAAVAAMFMLIAIGWSVKRLGSQDRIASWEEAAEFLESRNIAALDYFHDAPIYAPMTELMKGRIGGFVLLRDGVIDHVRSYTPTDQTVDPRLELASQALARPGQGFLWYKRNRPPNGSADRFPWKDFSWPNALECEEFSGQSYELLACINPLPRIMK